MVLSKWLSQRGIYIVGAKRTAFGSFGGSLSKLSATELAVHATKAALADANIVGDDKVSSLVNAVFVGNVIASSADAAYLARHVALESGLSPTASTALTINRLCGSGFETVIQGASSLLLDPSSQVVVCAGTENMSNAPLQVDGNAARWGTPLGKGWTARDSLWDGLTDSYIQTPMGVTAENLAKKYNITREESDEYAIRSQTLWGKAKEEGLFDTEMAPISIPNKKKKGDVILVDTDEHPRPDATLERISKLPPVFGGVVTAANASGICDGAGSIVLATEEAIHQHDLTPLARLVSCHVSGCDPNIMGIGPVQSIQQALADVNLDLHNDVDRVEINEAFAPQVLACAKELELDFDKTNIHGGAIALGHPLAASGSRIVAHLAHEFHTPGNEHHKIHVGSACIGGGQGIAVVLERP